MTGFTTIWFEVRVEQVEIYIFNQLVLSIATYIIPTYVPWSGTNLVLSTLRISRRWKISNLPRNCTRFANLCCCTAVQATTKNTSFGVRGDTCCSLKRTFFRKVVVRAGCRNLAHTSSTLDSLSIAKISVKLKFTCRGFLAQLSLKARFESEMVSCQTYLPKISPRRKSSRSCSPASSEMLALSCSSPAYRSVRLQPNELVC